MTPGGPRPRLRRVRPADAAAIVELVALCLDEYREFAPPGWSPPENPSELAHVHSRLETPRTGGFVATVDGVHMAHVLWIPAADSERLASSDPAMAYLWELFVAPEHRGRGLASRLLADATEDVRASHYREMRLLTPNGHARARRFYQREGWTLIGDWGVDTHLGLPLVEYGRRLRG